MTRKRKRGEGRYATTPSKRQCQPSTSPDTVNIDLCIHHPTLSLYYARVLTLRAYLVDHFKNEKENNPDDTECPISVETTDLDDLLDQTVIGVYEDVDLERICNLSSLKNQVSDSGEVLESEDWSQSHLVNFAIWTLLGETQVQDCQPWSHLLCRGFRRTAGARPEKLNSKNLLEAKYQNTNVEQFKGSQWDRILSLTGKRKFSVFLGLILHCGIFIPTQRGAGNFRQISGQPLADLPTLSSSRLSDSFTKKGGQVPHFPACITIGRSRILYAKPCLGDRGQPHFGLGQLHVLNHHRDSGSVSDTIQVLRAIFPRQFGPANTPSRPAMSRFSLEVVRPKPSEICESSATRGRLRTHKLPKRLRGTVFETARKLQVRHRLCSYSRLLRHYCPSDDEVRKGEPLETLPIAKYASSPASVSAFCRAVVNKIIPHCFWGVGDDGTQFKSHVFHQIDRFVHLSRFENLRLVDIAHGIRITRIPWLSPPGIARSCKISLSDFNKRREIFLEFLHFIFESITIPLLRTNFYITESQIHGKNRLFFYRHDIWQQISEPAISTIQLSMFEAWNPSGRGKFEFCQPLGCSQVRLIPKERGFRPIINLKRRSIFTINGSGHIKSGLGRSINKLLDPVHKVLKFESSVHPKLLGASLFSVDGVYSRLKLFKQHLEATYPQSNHTLYFAKVDVKACFDSIPQDKIVSLARKICKSDSYRLDRHAQIKASDDVHFDNLSRLNGRPVRRFVVNARSDKIPYSFGKFVDSELSVTTTNTIFCGNDYNVHYQRQAIQKFVESHVQHNIVRLGRKKYRQKCGISQGSAISTILCNLFYGNFETTYLSFLKSADYLLFRLIDDFLLITTNKHNAQKFLQIMFDGVPEYGITVNPVKTLVNFEVEINGLKVAKSTDAKSFPYCGYNIDPATLNLSRDISAQTSPRIRDSLTIDPGKTPGRSFYKKILNSFKMQSHSVLLDTDLNATKTVVSNLHQAFIFTGMKFYTYFRSLPAQSRPSLRLQKRTIDDIADVALLIIRSKVQKEASKGFKCNVGNLDVAWLAYSAFSSVLRRKQTCFGELLRWITCMLTKSAHRGTGKEEWLGKAALDIEKRMIAAWQ
ncbi:MAG: hypothetical protein M1814_004521 [Vezdaea aestivalis]|nr:MAG: hypothetical protein M1814_004521 [Vezdaea aestivalis]